MWTFTNVHWVHISCIVRKLLTRPFQRHHTWWGTWLTFKRLCRSYKVTGPISWASLESPLEDLSNDISHDGASYLKFTWPLTVDLMVTNSTCNVTYKIAKLWTVRKLERQQKTEDGRTDRRTDGRTDGQNRHSHKGVSLLNKQSENS
jgi:hypothetical protein